MDITVFSKLLLVREGHQQHLRVCLQLWPQLDVSSFKMTTKGPEHMLLLQALG